MKKSFFSTTLAIIATSNQEHVRWTVAYDSGRGEKQGETALKVKISPKSNLNFICECLWVKPSCKMHNYDKRGTLEADCSFVFPAS